MKNSPLVSIVITCYNYGNFIEDAVNSVEHQTYPNVEVIIINDGSTDSTDTVCKRLAAQYKSIRYLYQENRGIIATRNRGLTEARGTFIIFLDADDYLDKNYVHDTVQIALTDNVDIVYTDYKMFGARNETSSFPQFTLEELKNHNFIHIGSLIRAKAAKAAQFDEGIRQMSHEDWDFFLALCMSGAKAKKCASTFLWYRIHQQSRNNKLEDDKGRFKFAQVYQYIINKYPEYTEYLSGRMFSDWYIHMTYKVDGLEADLHRQQESHQALMDQNTALTKRLDSVQSSKYYKLYMFLRSLKSRVLK